MIRATAVTIAEVLLFGACLLGAAGSLSWPMAWALGIYSLPKAAAFAFLDPELIRERAAPGRTDLALDALEQALHARPHGEGQIHHSDRGVQYLSIHYTERLAEAGIESSFGSVGDSYDNALAESVIGLYKTEVVRARGPWRNIEEVEFATLEWVDWFNNRRLLQPLGYVPPAEYEEAYYRSQETPVAEAGLT